MHNAYVIVTFNPDLSKLSQQLRELNNIFQHKVIVDNSTILFLKEEIKQLCQKNKIELIDLKVNTGLGTAQNNALKLLKNRKVDLLMFLDDDSHFPANEIKNLIDSFEKISSEIPKVIGVGPLVEDVKTGETIAFGWRKNILRRLDIDESIKEVAFLISSGSLYDFNILTSQIGYLREDYFLDGIDMELGFRISSKGYKMYVTKSSKINHSLGDQVRKDNFGKILYLHNDPIRIYYQTRNHLLMLRDLPIKTIRKHLRILQIVMHSNFFSAFRYRRFRDLQMFFLGLLHAACQKRGPYLKRVRESELAEFKVL
jgi:rhamnosyltransferase